MSNTRTTFNPHYLAYVAEFGTTNLHAFNDAGVLKPGGRFVANEGMWTRDCSRNIEQTTTIWSPVCSSQESRHDTHFTGATIPPSPL